MWGSAEATDPQNGGSSLVNAAEIVLHALSAAGVRDVVEVGAADGDLTEVLLDRARDRGGKVTAIDPAPSDRLVELAARRPELELIPRTSLEALPGQPTADAVILDGDHNYFTVSEELRLLAAAATGTALPLIVLHDIGWPHARRDTYYEPDRIPEPLRQPFVRDATLDPSVTGIAEGGLPFGCAAEHEGGPRNGVLTALEDFLANREDLRFASVPVFWGIGFVWPHTATFSATLAEALAPYAESPLLERLEAHRVAHLVELCEVERRLSDLHGVERHNAMILHEQRLLLARMVGSSAFGLAERLSRLRQRGEPMFSRERVEEVLELDQRIAVDPPGGREDNGKPANGGASGGGPAAERAQSDAS